MNELDRWRLNHILGAAREAIAFTEGETRISLQADRKLILALAMEITIIGEATARLSDELKSEHPEIPWSAIVGMRNVLVHAYFRIDLDIVWEAINQDLPQLIAQLERIMPEPDS